LRNIDVHIYRAYFLLIELKSAGAYDESFNIDILKSCGNFTESSYIVINNEHAGGDGSGNPMSVLNHMLEMAYKKDFTEIFHGLRQQQKGITYVDPDKIDITLKDKK
jgi:hypothetical protein